jgi:Flp pilus assembly pilin Flp
MNKRRQSGQAMVEYIVVVAAIVTALIMAPKSDALEDLVSVLKNNYSGYSYSISGVHYYEPSSKAEAMVDDG